MAKTALTQLQDQIEAIRREAYAAGYAAAHAEPRRFHGAHHAATPDEPIVTSCRRACPRSLSGKSAR